MSMKISQNWEKDRKWYRMHKKPIKAYKRVSQDNISLWMRHEWGPGMNVSDRLNNEPSYKERNYLYINHGFHLYTNKDDAFKGAHHFKGKVMECLVDPQDIVAVGTFKDRKCLVATKAVVTQQVRRRPGRKQ